MREHGERWEAKQKEKELQHRIDALGTENSRLRKERNDAVRARYADQEEAMLSRNQLAARDAEVGRLGTLLTELQKNLAEGDEDDLRQRILDVQLDLARSQEHYASLDGENQALQASYSQLSQNNQNLQGEIARLHDVQEESNGLKRENRTLSNNNKLLRSQVGSYMVGNRVTLTQYLIQTAGNIPLVGKVFRKTSEQVYDQTHPRSPRGRR